MVGVGDQAMQGLCLRASHGRPVHDPTVDDLVEALDALDRGAVDFLVLFTVTPVDDGPYVQVCPVPGAAGWHLERSVDGIDDLEAVEVASLRVVHAVLLAWLHGLSDLEGLPWRRLTADELDRWP